MTPKKLESEDLNLFKCPKCKGVHFRHAGYLHTTVPYVKANREPEVAKDQCPVIVCVKCRKCYIDVHGQTYDVTDTIDLKAWEKAEKEMYKTTGPDGQC